MAGGRRVEPDPHSAVTRRVTPMAFLEMEGTWKVWWYQIMSTNPQFLQHPSCQEMVSVLLPLS